MSADRPGGNSNGWADALRAALRYARRLIVLVVGSTVLLIGLLMLVAPGPATLVIPIGLAILALEFAWARRLLKRVRSRIQQAVVGKPSFGPVCARRPWRSYVARELRLQWARLLTWLSRKRRGLRNRN